AGPLLHSGDDRCCYRWRATDLSAPAPPGGAPHRDRLPSGVFVIACSSLFRRGSILTVSAALLLAAAGALPVAASSPAARSALAASPAVGDIAPIVRPIVQATVGQGVALHGASGWQAAGITGKGVKVGIIDGGFIGLASRLGVELPATVHARCYSAVGTYQST